MKKIAVINGPNLNLLGTREPQIYGQKTLPELEDALKKKGKSLDLDIICFQSNHEGEIVDTIHQCAGVCQLIIINAGAFTHTSIAIRDALLACNIPAIEVHLSNVHRREPFRRFSYLSDIVIGIITGFGPKGYELAVEAAHEYLHTVLHS